MRLCAGLAAATIAALLATVAPADAQAARGLETGFSDYLYGSSDGGAREAAFRSTLDARAGIVRVNLVWRSVAAGQPVDPRSPADPAYDFTETDEAVSGAVANGLDAVITIYSAPDYAEGAGRPAGVGTGTWKPDPEAFADFAEAVAARYSGSFAGLPRVRYFQAWNEPSLSTYLTPQYEGQQAVAAPHYREMLNAFYDAVKGVNPDNQVVTAGTAPYGDPPGGERTRPLAFWRDVLCLNKELKATACPTRASFDILAHHPINTSGGPTRSAIDPDDASTPDFKNVAEVLRAAEKRNTIAVGGRHPLWATELWWDSNPPDTVEGVPLKRHARYIEQALYILWKQGATVVINLQLRDSPFNIDDPFADNSTGILFSDGSAKPAFTAFRFPFVTDPSGEERLTAWGKAPIAGRLAIQRKGGKSWRTVKRLNVEEGGVFKTKLGLARGRFRAKVGAQTSLAWRQR